MRSKRPPFTGPPAECTSTSIAPSLDRYIAAGRAETELLYLGVEWIFQVHNSRAVVINPAADLAMARNYASQYMKAGGAKLRVAMYFGAPKLGSRYSRSTTGSR